MPQVPQFTRQTKLNGKALPYTHVNLNGDMFGVNIATAEQNLASGLGDLSKAALEFQNKIEETKLLELSNNIDQWEQDNLYDKEKGYYYKSGKDAVGKAPEVMKSYDDFISEYKSKNKVTPQAQARMDDIIERKKTRITYGVNAHDYQQTNSWAKSEGEKGMDNAINGMVHARNNPDEMQTQMMNGLQVVKWQGMTQKLDSDTIGLMEKEFKSKAHEAVLNSYLNEGSLQAGEYYNKHKDEIKSDAQAKYIGAIKNNEMKYKSRSLADDIISKSKNEQEAVNQAEKIKDIDLSDLTVRRIKQHYAEQEQYKNQAERDALNGFYSKAVQAAQSGGTLSYDDIPDNVDPQTKLSLINYVQKNGEPNTEDDIWQTLYDMSVNNAQGFVKEDLNKYRGFLSDGEYKSFVKRQQEIKTGNFYTQIKDDDKMIKAALKDAGLNKNSVMWWGGDKKDIAYSEIKSMTRELETRKGRKITNDELSNIIHSLGYKDKDGLQLYKQLEKGMREKTGFIRDVVNDFTYYQSKHDGQLPSDEEKMKIINKRVNAVIQDQNEDLKNSLEDNISRITPKPHETKSLTYFADNQVPELEKQLGLKLTVTSRYRNQAGSHHKEGRAADISMSEHTAQNRIKIFEKILALPTVEKVGTSDVNVLTHFNGNPKIEDERKYDRTHGTNHVNHVHVTLTKNTNTNSANNIVRVKAPNGKIYLVPQNQTAAFVKNGGVILK